MGREAVNKCSCWQGSLSTPPPPTKKKKNLASSYELYQENRSKLMEFCKSCTLTHMGKYLCLSLLLKYYHSGITTGCIYKPISQVLMGPTIHSSQYTPSNRLKRFIRSVIKSHLEIIWQDQEEYLCLFDCFQKVNTPSNTSTSGPKFIKP